MYTYWYLKQVSINQFGFRWRYTTWSNLPTTVKIATKKHSHEKLLLWTLSTSSYFRPKCTELNQFLFCYQGICSIHVYFPINSKQIGNWIFYTNLESMSCSELNHFKFNLNWYVCILRRFSKMKRPISVSLLSDSFLGLSGQRVSSFLSSYRIYCQRLFFHFSTFPLYSPCHKMRIMSYRNTF